MNSENSLKEAPFLRPYFWSYDFDCLDKIADKQLIIFQILNWGNQQATNWLRDTYREEEIRLAISGSISTAWDKKSLTFWSFLYDTAPTRNTRFA